MCPRSIVDSIHVPAGNVNDRICVFSCAGEHSHAGASLTAQAYSCVDGEAGIVARCARMHICVHTWGLLIRVFVFADVRLCGIVICFHHGLDACIVLALGGCVIMFQQQAE